MAGFIGRLWGIGSTNDEIPSLSSSASGTESTPDSHVAEVHEEDPSERDSHVGVDGKADSGSPLLDTSLDSGPLSMPTALSSHVTISGQLLSSSTLVYQPTPQMEVSHVDEPASSSPLVDHNAESGLILDTSSQGSRVTGEDKASASDIIDVKEAEPVETPAMLPAEPKAKKPRVGYWENGIWMDGPRPKDTPNSTSSHVAILVKKALSREQNRCLLLPVIAKLRRLMSMNPRQTWIHQCHF